MGPLLVQVAVAFVLAAALLHRYGNWRKQHFIVTISVLLAWYFSLLIIFVLPLDVSSTVYRQCQEAASNSSGSGNGTACAEPWSLAPALALPQLWRVVYWSSQLLTWLVLPLMQSYSKAGDFSVRGRLRAALLDNATYYGLYLCICLLLLLYLAFKPGVDLDWGKTKAIAASASNTWGLFLLVLLLGHALVEVPRGLWRNACPRHALATAYFRAAKLAGERADADDALDDALEAVQSASLSIGPGHWLRPHLDVVVAKIPGQFRERMRRRPPTLPTDADVPDEPNERSLVRLHAQMKKALQMQHRTDAQWRALLEEAISLEEAARPAPVWPPNNHWLWRCREVSMKAGACFAAALSVIVVWSEATFFVRYPVLSILAGVVNWERAGLDYLAIEITSMIVLGYLCFCAYSTVFKVRVLNLYYLAAHHGTDEYSLIFSGMMLSRLTPAVSLNFLGLIHMDSHVIRRHLLETQYTQMMGHMDVIGVIADGINIYLPTALLALCGAAYFRLGQRLLSALGFPQFVSEQDDELTADLVQEGRDLVTREKRRRQRVEETSSRRREFHSASSLGVRRQKQRGVEDEAELLRDVEPPDYSTAQPPDMDEAPQRPRPNMPPRGLFDDV